MKYFWVFKIFPLKHHAQIIRNVRMALDVCGRKRWVVILVAHVLPALMDPYVKIVIVLNENLVLY